MDYLTFQQITWKIPKKKLPISCYACKSKKPLWKYFYRDVAGEEYIVGGELYTSELTDAFLEKWMKYIYEWSIIYILLCILLYNCQCLIDYEISSPNENFVNNKNFG